ncbi:GntR family transcriptional regulator [Cryptosporangium minutisporangium]|uniref:GntR family transcriptional regulator n=2 Tax=Cryptosporangium minutisporangium TaxID=113569 RepID=A0ABP6T1A1_9ACTN
MIDPHGDRAVYRQLADQLRADIASGEYGPGSLIPSEMTLMQRYGVARNTVRLAMTMLREEGLVVTHHGRGTYVRDALPIRRVASSRYRQALDAATTGAPLDWAEYRAESSFQEVPATDQVAGLLGIDTDTSVLERRILFLDGNLPQQLSMSYLPLDLVAGTPVADPRNEPWVGGTVAALASIGVTVTRVDELVRARMPRPEETRALSVAVGTPMLTITRTMFAGDRAVETAVDIVVPGDRAELEYRIDLAPVATTE